MSPNRFFAVVALVASASLPLAVMAQTPAPAPAPPAAGQPAHHHHGGRYMHALQTLGLSDAQKQQITAAVAQMRQTNQNADPQTKHANMQQLRSQIDGILTPSQRAQLQTELQNERAHPMPAPVATTAPHA